jgi:hypothetical protein
LTQFYAESELSGQLVCESVVLDLQLRFRVSAVLNHLQAACSTFKFFFALSHSVAFILKKLVPARTTDFSSVH